MPQVTLTLARALMADRTTKYDLRTFIEAVPSVKVVAGNPQYSIRIEIEQKHLPALQAAVEGRCTITFVTELDQLAVPEG